jgi:hypothetical protein
VSRHSVHCVNSVRGMAAANGGRASDSPRSVSYWQFVDIEAVTALQFATVRSELTEMESRFHSPPLLVIDCLERFPGRSVEQQRVDLAAIELVKQTRCSAVLIRA